MTVLILLFVLTHLTTDCSNTFVEINAFPLLSTASLAKWLRRPPRKRKVRGSNSACVGIFSESSHTSDLKIGIPVATLSGDWRYRVSVGTGLPGVSIL